MAVSPAWRWPPLYLSHFLQLYDGIDMGRNGVINLIADDASIIVRRPFHEADIGTSLAKSPLFTRLLPQGSSGTATVRSMLDGVERVVGYRRVEGLSVDRLAALNRRKCWRAGARSHWLQCGYRRAVARGAEGARLSL